MGTAKLAPSRILPSRYPAKGCASSAMRFGMSSTTGYSRRQALHISALPSALNSRCPLHLGQAMISSSFGSSGMAAFILGGAFAHQAEAGSGFSR